MQEIKPLIEFPEFLEIEKKIDIRWGRIAKVERVPKSTKLLKLEVLFSTGEIESESLTVVTNIGQHFPEGEEQELVWRTFPFVVNLKPSKMMGIESQAMIVVSTDANGKILFNRDWPPAGSKLI